MARRGFEHHIRRERTYLVTRNRLEQDPAAGDARYRRVNGRGRATDRAGAAWGNKKSSDKENQHHEPTGPEKRGVRGGYGESTADANRPTPSIEILRNYDQKQERADRFVAFRPEKDHQRHDARAVDRPARGSPRCETTMVNGRAGRDRNEGNEVR